MDGEAELMERDCRFSRRQAGWVDGGRAELMEWDCRFSERRTGWVG